MTIHFVIKGRLGNAIFRYMACVVLCVVYNNEYSSNSNGNINLTDDIFLNMSLSLLKNQYITLPKGNLNMIGFYQHD